MNEAEDTYVEELDLNQADLKEVSISDDNLEVSDNESILARKKAKKDSKKYRTPEEKKRAKHKKVLILSVVTVFLLFALLAIPLTRWPLLNAVGFRGNLVITVQDTTKKAVSGVIVKLSDGTTHPTDSFGRSSFAEVKLGKNTVSIQKVGYGEKTEAFTSSFGQTKKTVELKVIGIKLDVDIKDWLSTEAIHAAVVKYNQVIATSDKTGRASIVIPPTDEANIQLEVSAPGYQTKTISTATNVLIREVALVSAQKNYFISKRDGKFDIFSSNLDGTDQRKIIEATGKEDESILQFSINRNNKQAILVATRDGKVQAGRLVAGIYLVDLEKATFKKIDEGSDVQLLDWSENTAVYTKSDSSLSYDDQNLSRIVSFNTVTSKLNQISQANYFQINLVAQSKVFYLPSDAYRTIEGGVLTSLDINTGLKKTYLADKQINYASHASYNTLELQNNSGANFELQVGSGATKAIDRRPGTSLSFSLSPSGQFVNWSDRRDGQGALIVRNIKEATDRVAVRTGGLTGPVRFISDNLAVVRVATSQETSDYIVYIPTGKIGKIVDVSNIGTSRGIGL